MLCCTVIFDLDETLTDPKSGITRCIQYALSELGYQPPDANELLWCIGQPLKSIVSWENYFHLFTTCTLEFLYLYFKLLLFYPVVNTSIIVLYIFQIERSACSSASLSPTLHTLEPSNI